MAYKTTIPNNTRYTKIFKSLRKAKQYARELFADQSADSPGWSSDSLPIVSDPDVGGRLIRLQPNGQFDYSAAPDSWK